MSGATFLAVFLLALAAVAIAVLAMAIGPIFGRRCVRGSCSGADRHDDDERLRCDDCPNRRQSADAAPLLRSGTLSGETKAAPGAPTTGAGITGRAR